MLHETAFFFHAIWNQDPSAPVNLFMNQEWTRSRSSLWPNWGLINLCALWWREKQMWRKKTHSLHVTKGFGDFPRFLKPGGCNFSHSSGKHPRTSRLWDICQLFTFVHSIYLYGPMCHYENASTFRCSKRKARWLRCHAAQLWYHIECPLGASLWGSTSAWAAVQISLRGLLLCWLPGLASLVSDLKVSSCHLYCEANQDLSLRSLWRIPLF